MKLENSQFNGLSYDELPDRFRRILDDTYITTTIIILDSKPESYNAVYDVFARLNSGGTQLTPHEIRMALYNGKLMALVDNANSNESWRRLYGSTMPNKRFRDHELVLRIIALYLDEDSYSKPLGGFLNNFSEKHRLGTDLELVQSLDVFERTAEVLANTRVDLFSLPGRKQINTARADSIMVGFMHALADGATIDEKLIDHVSITLSKDLAYEDATTSATSDDAQVHARISIVRRAIG